MLGQDLPLISDLEQRLSASIVTPAERVSQYALIGAGSGAALSAIVGLSLRRPLRSPFKLIALLAVPVVGTGAGIYFAAKTSQGVA